MTQSEALAEARRELNKAVTWLEHFKALLGLHDEGPVGGSGSDPVKIPVYDAWGKAGRLVDVDDLGTISQVEQARAFFTSKAMKSVIWESTPNKIASAQDLVRMLWERVDASSQKEVAASLEISKPFLNDVLHGRRNITNRVASRLGFERVFRRIA